MPTRTAGWKIPLHPTPAPGSTRRTRITRATLDALPGRNALRQRLLTLNTADTRIREVQRAGDRIFFMRRNGDEQHHRLYVQEGLAGTPRMLVDPEHYIPGDEGSALIDYYSASPNGKRIAFGVAQGGSEDASLHVIDVDTGKPLGPPVPRARWAGPTWRFDSTVLFYTQQKAWPAGTPAADLLKDSRAMMRTYEADGTYAEAPVFGARPRRRRRDGSPTTRQRSAYRPSRPLRSASIQHGTQSEQTLYVARMNTLKSGATPWRRLAGPERGIVGYDVRGEWIYLVTNENAPRYRVVALVAQRPAAVRAGGCGRGRARVHPRDQRGVSVAKDALYVQQMDAGYSKLLRLEFNVRPAKGRGRATPARGAALPAKPSGVARSTEIRLPFAGTIDERVDRSAARRARCCG